MRRGVQVLGDLGQALSLGESEARGVCRPLGRLRQPLSAFDGASAPLTGLDPRFWELAGVGHTPP